MRFMMLVKASKASEAGVMPDDSLIAAMTKYNEEMAKAGILLDLAGMPIGGWRLSAMGAVA